MNDFIKELDKRLEWDNRFIGQQTMMEVVLKWAVDSRAWMPPETLAALVRTMQGSLDAAMVERPLIVQPQEGTCAE